MCEDFKVDAVVLCAAWHFWLRKRFKLCRLRCTVRETVAREIYSHACHDADPHPHLRVVNNNIGQIVCLSINGTLWPA